MCLVNKILCFPGIAYAVIKLCSLLVVSMKSE